MVRSGFHTVEIRHNVAGVGYPGCFCTRWHALANVEVLAAISEMPSTPYCASGGELPDLPWGKALFAKAPTEKEQAQQEAML